MFGNKNDHHGYMLTPIKPKKEKGPTFLGWIIGIFFIVAVVNSFTEEENDNPFADVTTESAPGLFD